jgi:AraC-like DNA-binding protein
VRVNTVAPGFTYGVGPTRYRIEARARFAWQMIIEGVAEIAAAAGYADQAHMTREVKAFTGRSPGAWHLTLRAACGSVDSRSRSPASWSA